MAGVKLELLVVVVVVVGDGTEKWTVRWNGVALILCLGSTSDVDRTWIS